MDIRPDGRGTVTGDSGVKRRGQLKIFFGYADGVGKTYAMLSAAHGAMDRGVDVVAGYVEPRSSPQTQALLTGLEQLPKMTVRQNSAAAREFDLDAALKRDAQLMLVDELAHHNAQSCRHERRYQDVQELLSAGIDVYTTVNVQNIESLNDLVASITGIQVAERIPDSVFDSADQVELVDIEPRELLERLGSGAPRGSEADSIYTVEKLTGLREIALRRCADRMNLITETASFSGRDYHTDEHILVCLSSAPSNAKIIRTAARMASAFRGRFTALFVETPDFTGLEETDKKRLRANIRLARQLGAAIETVYGEDVPYQIAEFARLSGVSKIVIGRSTVGRRHFFGRPNLTEKLIEIAPNLDIHIIPDSSAPGGYRPKTGKKTGGGVPLRDVLWSLAILIAATLAGMFFFSLGFTETNIIIIYILGVLITSVVTTNRMCSIISSIVSVLVFNFFFTVPRYTLLAYDKSYIVTFAVMFLAALISGNLAARLKEHAAQSAHAAYRTKVLFDTNQLLQKVHGSGEIIDATANQLVKLLDRDVVLYPAEGTELGEANLYGAAELDGGGEYLTPDERAVADWVLRNNRHAGASTDSFSGAKCMYLAIRVGEHVYGVVGIAAGEDPLDAFENSVLLSILGECALALESDKNAREKEAAAILAENERLRANLLRAISHDLRTPLTSISGNASNLLSNPDGFDESTRRQIYTDIYDDSMWLINLVENLLSVTRIEEGRMGLRFSAELIDEVVAEALRHVDRKSVEHEISVDVPELVLARMDAKLIVQVIINLVDNAVNTRPQAQRYLSARKRPAAWCPSASGTTGRAFRTR